MIGKIISHYKILETLGRGGMGVVYKAQDLKLDRFVALKFLPNTFSLNEEAKQRFINEAKAASSLQHHNICTIHEIDETKEGQLFICMDYYVGATLREKIQSKLLTIQDSVEILIKVLEGLSFAHEKEIIHRDIKPENIFITDKNHVKILDFGLAQNSAYTKITRQDRTSGTIAYISPEQAQSKETTNKSDIWSLGIVMYEMLTGKQPFKGEYDQVIIYSILDKKPEKITAINPEIPVELETIVNKALEKDPNLRYQNAGEMLFDLRSFKNKSSNSENTQSTVFKKHKRSWIKASIIALLFIVVALYFVSKFVVEEKTDYIPVTLAVVGFENQTGDSTYNYLRKAIPNLLITNLEQSKHLKVTTWERMQDLLKQTHKKKVKIIDKDLGFEISRAAGIDAVVVGSFIKAGNVFATDVKVLDARTKKLLKSASIKSNGLASILNNQIDYLSDEIISGVGISAKDIESVKLRIADVSTTSMEAYGLFLKGREEYNRACYVEALKYLEKAVQIDSTFAVAYLFIGLAQHYIYEDRKEKIAFSKAEKYKDNATDREKLYIEALYEMIVNKNIEKSTEIFEVDAAKYPKEKFLHFWLGYLYMYQRKYISAQKEFNEALKLDPEYGITYKTIAFSYAQQGEYQKAVENMNKYVSMYPQNADPYSSLGYLFNKMGKIDDALFQTRKAIKIKSDIWGSGILPALLFMKEEYAEGLKWQDKLIKMWRTESMRMASLWWKSFDLYWVGRIEEALNILKTYENNNKSEKQWIVRSYWLKGWIYYNQGQYEQSKKCFSKYSENYNLKIRDIARSIFYYGLINLKMGEMDSARTKLRKLKDLSNNIRADLSNNVIANYYLLYGKILMEEDSLEKAEKVLENKPPHKLLFYQMANWFRINEFNDPLLQDDLALIYIKKGELDKAIIEYEKLVSPDVKVRGSHFINPRYHYRFAKLYEKKSSIEKAIMEYKKFLKIWKNADKDLPELIDAKQRLVQIKGKKRSIRKTFIY